MSLSERARRITQRADAARHELTQQLAQLHQQKGFVHYYDDKGSGARVWRRTFSDGRNEALQAVAMVDMSPAACSTNLEDTAQYLQWDPSFVAENIFETWEVSGVKYAFYRNQHDGALGGLVSPRELVNVRVTETLPDGSVDVFFCSLEGEEGDMPANASIVRAWNWPSKMHFKKVGENKTEMTFYLHMDIRGSVPFWLVKGALGKQLVDAIVFVQKLALARK